MYGNQHSVGQNTIGSTQYKVSYATLDGLYNGANQSSRPKGTIEGLGGRAIDTRGGHELRIFEASGINQLNTLNKQCSIVVHLISEKDAADGVILEIDPATGGSNSPITLSVASNKVVATVYDTDGTGNAVTITSLSSLPRDGETPTCVILTVDTEISDSNLKLFINGALESASGSLKETATSSNWENTRTIRGGSNITLKAGAFQGIYEEIIIYNHVIYPFEFMSASEVEISIMKNAEELANNANGRPQIYNARAFVFDYHNLRGDVCGASPNAVFL
jgi:hypothetical protein